MSHPASPLHELGTLLVVGAGCQFLASRLRLPSILFLLAAGLGLGPGLGLLDPDALFGPLLLPFATLSVALIMFEGGLGLKLQDLRTIGGIYLRLATIGVVVSWGGAALAAHWILELPRDLSVLLGAVLVVTGPTVILPLLRQVRLRPPLGPILRWEGIGNDPLGALLAVLVFEGILHGNLAQARGEVVLHLAQTLVLGFLLGLAVGALLRVSLERDWIHDTIEGSVVLGVVTATFLGGNALAEEAGLVAVTVAGVHLANQDRTPVRHIIEFKEHLGTVLLGMLFLLLSARVPREALTSLDHRALLFVLALVLVVRPLAIALSTPGTQLGTGERVFLAAMAPRGIVAVAITSIFALRLEQAGVPRADELMPLMVLVVVTTVTFSSLAAAPLSRALGVAEDSPRGALILGANPLGLALARTLHKLEVPVLLADRNWYRLSKARLEGLPTFWGNALSEAAHHDIDFEGLGCLLALTANDEVNALAGMHMSEHFGRGRVYQVAPTETAAKEKAQLSRELRSHLLFDPEEDLQRLVARLRRGDELTTTPLTDEFTEGHLVEQFGEDALFLFRIRPGKPLEVFTEQVEAETEAGDVLVTLVPRPGPLVSPGEVELEPEEEPASVIP